MTSIRRTRSCRQVIKLVLALSIATVSLALSAQDISTDLHFHKFLPETAPDQSSPAANNQIQGSRAIALSAVQQMQALEDEKNSRTPAQRKIDSNVLYTTRMLLGKAAAPGIPSLSTGVDVDQHNDIVVDIVANVTPPLLQQLQSAKAVVLYTNAGLRSIRAIIPPEQMENIAASPDVIFISPKQESATHRVQPPKSIGLMMRYLTPGFDLRAAHVRHELGALVQSVGTGQGRVTTEGDLTHRASDARGAFGVNGSGLKIGVLSDGVTSLALSQATGDLPVACGTPPCVTVLPGQTGAGDEGTAMMEIIHDMAPGASLYFATADNSITSFAQNILDLRAAGCDIIVDDVFYFVETPFQDGQTVSVVSTSNGGVVTQAVNDVVADGALYFSSAGNEGNLDDLTSGTFEGDFNGVASGSPLPSGNVHSFGGTPYDTIVSPGLGVVALWWADPLGASTNDYDLFVLNSNSTSVLAASTNIQNGTQDPIEILGSGAVATGNRIVVLQNTGSSNRFFHLGDFRGTLAVNTAGETHGHSAASGAYTVAATPAAVAFGIGYPAGPYPNAFNAANTVELFTSDGPRQIFFHGDSSPITPGNFSSTGGAILSKPDVTAADGVSVTGVGGFGSPFFGTSAAAPSAAAVAALVKSAQPSLTPAQIRAALNSTAIDIVDAGIDRNSGSGIVMAWEAVNSLGVTGFANPELGAVTAAENPGNANGTIEAGEGASLVIQLKNTSGVVDATAITATLTSSTTGITITQPNTSAYANLTAGSGVGNNLSPFTFTVPSNFACGQTVDFTLTVTYTGGPTRALDFSVPTGLLTFTNNLGTTPATVTGLTTRTGTQTNRVSRNGVASTCGTAKAYPGAIAAGSRAFDSYKFTACRATCLSTAIASSNAINLFEVDYSPSFDPTNIATNYAGDAGLSASGQACSIDTVTSTDYEIVVHDVSGAAVGSSYSLQLPVCAFNCNANRVPVAVAHNVTVTAATVGGTASADINNGSSDADGDTLTITQSPAGPYSVGTTSVRLTVVDTKGATAQATANVTVQNPDDFTLAPTLPTVTVTAGQTGTEHITFTPIPATSNTITFTCSNLSAKTTCTFVPATVAATNAPVDVALSVKTTAATTSALKHLRDLYAAWIPFASLGLAGLVTIGRRRKPRKSAIFLTVLFLMLAGFLIGCGSGSHTPITTPGTPPGTYTVTVTGTSSSVAHSTTFSLTVN